MVTWFIDIFGQPLVGLLLGLAGLVIVGVILFIALFIFSILYIVGYEIGEYVLIKLKIIPESHWRKLLREERELTKRR